MHCWASQLIRQAQPDLRLLKMAASSGVYSIGNKVPFNSYRSRQYIQSRFFPDKPISRVKVGDADEIMGYTVNVDEIIPRQIGGLQVFDNQRILSERLNKALGPIEERALRNYSNGMKVQGFSAIPGQRTPIC